MTVQTNAKPETRLFFLDNIRIYLTILVILHHAAIAYGGVGDWGIKDPATDEISPIFLTLFNAINQSYFMSAFFLFAGYFTPRSFEKKGAGQFILDRLIRLGIPIVIYTTLLINLNAYILSVFASGIPYQLRLEYNPGHLWFLQALLLFAGVYVVFRALTKQSTVNTPTRYFQDSFPPDKVLFFSIGILVIFTFLVRSVIPVGVWVFHLQLGHFSHYIFSFFVGILAYRGDWFRHLSKTQARRWGWIALAMIPFFFVLFIAGGALESEDNIVKFLGGWYWQSFAYAVWETILLIAINVFLIYFFRERFNHTGSIAKSMAGSVFTVYIIHQTLLYLAQALMLPVNIPSILKFFIVPLIVVPICFLLAIPIRKIPYAKRVL